MRIASRTRPEGRGSIPVTAPGYWVSPSGAATWANAYSTTPLNGTDCCSLATALTNVSAGHTVWLRSGSYDRGIILLARNGTSTDRITFAAYPGDTPELTNTANPPFTDRYYGVYLRASSYITIRGITFYRPSGNYLMEMHWAASYNELDGCTFDGNGGGEVRIWEGADGAGACVHNWIHDCTFLATGSLYWDGSVVQDGGGMQLGVPAYDDVSGHTTIEGCTFFCGGHHNLETFTKHNVIRNNFFHNEGSMTNGTGHATTYGADTNSQWGNRNLQIYDGLSNDGMFNLIEGNRFGPSGPPPDDDGGDGLTITAPKNIIRHNDIYSAQNNGVLFKIGSGSLSNNNRFYNNTVYASGRFENTGPQWQGYNIRFYDSTVDAEGNVLVNNLIYGPAATGDIVHATNTAATNTLTNNWLTSDGDPEFVDATVAIFPATSVDPDLSLQATSGCIDAGTHLTQTNGAGSGSVTLVVDDALYFQDGTLGSSLAGHVADWIAIGTVGNVVQIGSIDYATQTITLASAATWADNAPVWLYKKSDGVVVLTGSAPDIGAHEFGA